MVASRMSSTGSAFCGSGICCDAPQVSIQVSAEASFVFGGLCLDFAGEVAAAASNTTPHTETARNSRARIVIHRLRQNQSLCGPSNSVQGRRSLVVAPTLLRCLRDTATPVLR